MLLVNKIKNMISYFHINKKSMICMYQNMQKTNQFRIKILNKDF